MKFSVIINAVEYLAERGVLPTDDSVAFVLDLLGAVHTGLVTVRDLAANDCVSVRGYHRRLGASGARVKRVKSWIQLYRGLEAAVVLQENCDQTDALVSRRLGYPDPSTFSNAILRATGLRPSEIRELLGERGGIRLLVDAWIRRQGRLERTRAVVA